MDAVCVNAGIIVAFYVRFGGQLPRFNFQAYTRLAVLITVIQLAALYVYDLYRADAMHSTSDIVAGILKATTLGIVLTVVLTFLFRVFSFPRTVFFMSWLLLAVLLTGWRLLAARVLKIHWPEQRVLIVGADDAVGDIVREISTQQQWGYRLVGLLALKPEEVGREIGGAEVIGTVDDMTRVIKERGVDRVIVASPVRHRELIEELARSNEMKVKVEVIPDLYEIFVGRVDHTLISDIPLVELTRGNVPDWVRTTKRLSDIVAAGVLLLLTLPVMLVTAALVKLTSKGRVLYRQERVGQWEKAFTIYKFRTMVAGAEDDSGPVLATEDDARLTPVGKFLRRYRLDELPQLVNIIRGDMSFVGPRPERPFFVEEFKREVPGYAERFAVKPGVSGLAAVSGSYGTTARNKLKYDLIYIYHQSLILDAKIMLHTIKVVLTGRGAR